ncbi:uncharacterized protein BDR25DRAFT_328371 [Lindgomyces ingoldianus]|uniref:Uncharacterized protein n=1 Tax=Lindgomyces ingoldianus TaxID=673940 RepID=A0ACB6QI31_9PLEO|nr:uncharacterized protein BDR25DRAFT_328371 [Lindgomyces ingoldianus]KAF2465987.1 hypothetical protein BDR25DRAFT_328371 [Lindgomyces ingoldianus]
MSTPVWNALVRTHHITSRKKVTKLRAAASNYAVFVLLRSGGCPGIMYCEGHESGVKDWVSIVQGLRYKDFQLVQKVAPLHIDGRDKGVKEQQTEYGKLQEVGSVKEFGARMEELGVWEWWRKGMGYVHQD